MLFWKFAPTFAFASSFLIAVRVLKAEKGGRQQSTNITVTLTVTELWVNSLRKAEFVREIGGKTDHCHLCIHRILETMTILGWTKSAHNGIGPKLRPLQSLDLIVLCDIFVVNCVSSKRQNRPAMLSSAFREAANHVRPRIQSLSLRFHLSTLGWKENLILSVEKKIAADLCLDPVVHNSPWKRPSTLARKLYNSAGDFMYDFYSLRILHLKFIYLISLFKTWENLFFEKNSLKR